MSLKSGHWIDNWVSFFNAISFRSIHRLNERLYMFYWRLVCLSVYEKKDFFFIFLFLFSLIPNFIMAWVKHISFIFIHFLGYTFFVRFNGFGDLKRQIYTFGKKNYEPHVLFLITLYIIHHLSVFLLPCLSSSLIKFRISRELLDCWLWFATINQFFI